MVRSPHSDSAWSPVPLARSAGAVIQARANGRTYRIAVSTPQADPPEGGFPSLIVLDGAALFATIAETERRLSHRPEATGVQPTVIIGVGHDGDGLYDGPQRHCDFTPGPSVDAGVGPCETGGADRFLDFLTEELPTLAAQRAVLDPGRRALMGHSLAGYFSLHALIRRPAAFAAYGAISPSIWWNPAHILQGLKTLSAPSPRLFLAVGALEQPPAGSPKADRRMVGAAEDVAAAARAAGLAEVQSLVLPDENHASVVAPAAARFLRFIGAA